MLPPVLGRAPAAESRLTLDAQTGTDSCARTRVDWRGQSESDWAKCKEEQCKVNSLQFKGVSMMLGLEQRGILHSNFVFLVKPSIMNLTCHK